MTDQEIGRRRSRSTVPHHAASGFSQILSVDLLYRECQTARPRRVVGFGSQLLLGDLHSSRRSIPALRKRITPTDRLLDSDPVLRPTQTPSACPSGPRHTLHPRRSHAHRSRFRSLAARSCLPPGSLTPAQPTWCGRPDHSRPFGPAWEPATASRLVTARETMGRRVTPIQEDQACSDPALALRLTLKRTLVGIWWPTVFLHDIQKVRVRILSGPQLS